MATFRVIAPRNALNGRYGYPGYLTLWDAEWLPVEDVTAGGALGTLTRTLDALTLAATGTVSGAAVVIAGTLTQTLDGLTLAAIGTVSGAAVVITGTLTRTLAALTLTGQGTVTDGPPAGPSGLLPWWLMRMRRRFEDEDA